MQKPTSRPAVSCRTTIPRTLMLAVGILLGASDPIAAQVPRLLRDINTRFTGDNAAHPQRLIRAGRFIFFLADTPRSGLELHCTDGTPAGTQCLGDIGAGALGCFAKAFVGFGNSAMFLAHADDGSPFLWHTDGTAAGTVRIERIVAQHSTSDWIGGGGVLGNVAVFLVGDGFGTKLYRSDGTAFGTFEIASWPGGSLGSEFVEYRGALFVHVGNQLYRTDGTSTGTVPVTPADRMALAVLPGVGVFFRQDDQVMVTDGVQSHALATTSGYTVRDLRATSSAVYFADRDTLYCTDGTAAGTLAVATVPGLHWSGTTAVVGGNLFFTAGGTFGAPDELWRTDGTRAGTQRIWRFGVRAQLGGLVSMGTEVALGVDGAVWSSDGTTAGTRRMDLVEGELGVGELATLGNGRLIHTTATAVFSTDGTVAGTRLLGNFTMARQSDSSRPSHFTALGSRALFAADDGWRHGLWATDGTTAGTVLLSAPLYVDPATDPVVMNGRAFFVAGQGPGGDLWQSDGTSAGTHIVVDLVPGVSDDQISGLTAVNERWLVFSAVEPGGGHELWVSDGSAAGTQRIDVNPAGGSEPAVFTVLGSRVLFCASGLSRLYCTDGTALGTRRIFDLAPGSRVTQMTYHQGAVYFLANANAVWGLWRTDGTPSGTTLVTRAQNLSDSLVSAGDWLFLRSFGSAREGVEPWVSDGTAAGTRLLADLVPGQGSSFPHGFTPTDRGVVFAAKGVAAPTTLWRTDGTTAGTVEVGPALVSDLFAAGSRSAWLLSTVAAYRTDGTPAGTKLMPNLAGAGLARPVVVGGKVLGVLDDGVHGLEPWVLDDGARAVPIGQGCGDATRSPQLAATDPVLGREVAFTGHSIRAGAQVVVLLGTPLLAPIRLPSTSCSLYVDIGGAPIALTASANNTRFSLRMRVPENPALIDLRLVAQSLAGPGGGALGLDVSNGVALNLGR